MNIKELNDNLIEEFLNALGVDCFRIAFNKNKHLNSLIKGFRLKSVTLDRFVKISKKEIKNNNSYLIGLCDDVFENNIKIINEDIETFKRKGYGEKFSKYLSLNKHSDLSMRQFIYHYYEISDDVINDTENFIEIIHFFNKQFSEINHSIQNENKNLNNEDLKKDNDYLKKCLKEEKLNCEKLEKDLNGCKNDISNLRNDINDTKLSLDKLQLENKKLIGNQTNFDKELEKNQEELNYIQNALNLINTDLNNLNSSLSKLDSYNNALNKQNERITNVENSLNDFEYIIKNKNDSKLENKILELTRNVENLKSIIDNLKIEGIQFNQVSNDKYIKDQSIYKNFEERVSEFTNDVIKNKDESKFLKSFIITSLNTVKPILANSNSALVLTKISSSLLTGGNYFIIDVYDYNKLPSIYEQISNIVNRNERTVFLIRGLVSNFDYHLFLDYIKRFNKSVKFIFEYTYNEELKFLPVEILDEFLLFTGTLLDEELDVPYISQFMPYLEKDSVEIRHLIKDFDLNNSFINYPSCDLCGVILYSFIGYKCIHDNLTFEECLDLISNYDLKNLLKGDL